MMSPRKNKNKPEGREWARRFLVTPKQLGDPFPELSGDQARHASTVLRLAPGDTVILLDGGGEEFYARILKDPHPSPKRIRLEILGPHEATPEPAVELTLGLSLVKLAQMEDVIRRGTELGLSFLTPVITKRSAVRLSSKRAEAKQERWQRIALESLKQCNRSRPIGVKPTLAFTDFLKATENFPLKIMLYEELSSEASPGWSQVFAEKKHPEKVAVLVGPEGGFTEVEAAYAKDAGYHLLGLGPRIMRSSTAAAALLAVLGFFLGDLSDFKNKF